MERSHQHISRRTQKQFLLGRRNGDPPGSLRAGSSAGILAHVGERRFFDDRGAAAGWAADSVSSRESGAIASGNGFRRDRKSTRLNSSHGYISYAVFCLKKKNKNTSD